MKKILTLFVFILAMLGMHQVAESAQIAKDGKTDYVIVLPKESTPVQKTAAEELANYLTKITGATFPIEEETPNVEDSSRHQFLIGPSPAVEKLLTQAGRPGEADYGYDTTRIESIENTIILTGHSVRGPLYAVYTLLEDDLGCHWWAADEETVPQLPTLSVSIPTYFYTPQLYSRETDFPGMTGENGKFAAKVKLNGACHPVPNEFGGHISFELFVHSFYQLIPPEKYFLDHPDWFPEIDGHRVATRPEWWRPQKEYYEFEKKLQPEQIYPPGTQLCLTNDGLVQEMAKNAIALLDKNPNANIISISQNDCNGFCTCEKCRAIDEEEGSHSGTLVRFVNKVAEEIEKVHPDVYVETLAYTYSRKPPKVTHARHNVLIRLCSIECVFNRPLEEGGPNQSFKEDIEEWGKKADHLFIWDYVTNHGAYFTPFPNINILDDNIRFFVDHHTMGLFEQADMLHKTGDYTQLRAWVTAKLLWDPSLDQGELMNQFIAGYYAPELVPLFRQYFDILHNITLEKNINLYCFEKSTNRWLDYDTLAEATRLQNKALEIARTLAANDPARYAALPEKVLRDRIPLDLVWLEGWKESRLEAEKLGKDFPGTDDPQALAKDFIARLDKYGIEKYLNCWVADDDVKALKQSITDRYDPANEAPLPEMFKDIPADRIFDWQESTFTMERPGVLAEYVNDPAASNGKAVRITGAVAGIGMTIQCGRLFGALEQFHDGLDKVHAYVFMRTESKQNEGEAVDLGYSDDIQIYYSVLVPIMGIKGSEYKMIDLGTIEPKQSQYIWFTPAPSSAIDGVWVDRVIFVRE